MTDHFYVSKRFYDELAARNPDDVRDLIVGDKVEGYDVWSEPAYKTQEAIDNLKDDITVALGPILVPIVDALIKIGNGLNIK